MATSVVTARTIPRVRAGTRTVPFRGGRPTRGVRCWCGARALEDPAPPAPAARSAGAGKLRPVAPLGDARAPHAERRSRRPVDLPVLRRRLWPEGLRLRREGRPDRGRSRLAGLARPAVPEGRGLARLRQQPAARD